MTRSAKGRLAQRIGRPIKSLLAATVMGLGTSFAAMQAQADTLWEIYLQALDNDPQLAADRAAYRAGLEAKNLGRSALLPQVNASAEASKTKTDFSSVGTQFDNTTGALFGFTTRGDSDVDSTSYGARLDQALFDLPAWFGYKQGKTVSEQATAEFSANQQDMMVRVAAAYFDVLRAHDVLEAALAEEEALAKQLEQTQQRFEVGLTAITDVYDSRSAYDSAVARRLTAQDDLLSNFDALSVLTGRDHDVVAPLQPGFTVAAPDPADRASWVEFALANNFSLKAARLSADAARYGARAAAADHLPTLTGSLSYRNIDEDGERNSVTSAEGRGSVRSSIPIDGSTEISIAAISFNMPLYSGGRLSASRREARNQAFQAEDIRNLTERNTIQDTRTLHRAVTTDTSRVEAREQAVISAKSALDATQAGYEVGTRNIVDVLLAQRTLALAKTDYANALYDYILNTLNLKLVAGLLAPEDLQQLDASLNPASPVSRAHILDSGAASFSK
ncbi:TolC family outer membrane protein [Microbulbifer hydrolyticus]|uniref:Outer membrane protein n=1 Tax=Microbulbifer hydrolyticus TaxID=48074 RepID=A0A6P1T951_9GAMM|nr:TolC family outer membrane protein [Microbulbifer hydrolyticus]MBB5211120.1 outer membrane protein [Microbulbifer hydrolyticus]QHQ38096.1 TolC family outer membrane protein [Microbulbifer hydrolyticus]